MYVFHSSFEVGGKYLSLYLIQDQLFIYVIFLLPQLAEES